MPSEKRLSARQVLARMRRGDLPRPTGAWSDQVVFDDGAIASSAVMKKLHKQGKVERPARASLDSRWTLAVEV